MKVYVSGRIKDYDQFLDHFQSAEDRLIQTGHEVINPCKVDAGADPTYEDYMRADLRELLDCGAIYMLSGWERSVGARCEHMVAAMCGLVIWYERS